MIEVKNLTKTYYTYERGNTFKETVMSLFNRKKIEVNAVKDINFSIEEGELIGFIGPNGAGKSTTLKMLTGILYPTSGTAEIMGYIPWKERKHYVANIGAVFGQKSQLIWDIPPLDAFHMNKAIYSIADKDFKKRLDEMVELLDVGHVIKKPTRQLSLGERMKCEFIMCMLHNPKIVFLDEPTIGLDVIAKDKIREFIIEMNKNGTTFILTTHDIDDIEHLAKRVIIINHGDKIFDDSLNSLKQHMGNKKVIEISTNEELPRFDIEGVTVLQINSKYDIELELDISKIKINEFIEKVNETNTINDMSIQELPIERVIKELYV